MTDAGIFATSIPKSFESYGYIVRTEKASTGEADKL